MDCVQVHFYYTAEILHHIDEKLVLLCSSLKKGSSKFCLALLHMEMSVPHWVYKTMCMNSPRTVTTCKEYKFCGSVPRISIYSGNFFSSRITQCVDQAITAPGKECYPKNF